MTVTDKFPNLRKICANPKYQVCAAVCCRLRPVSPCRALDVSPHTPLPRLSCLVSFVPSPTLALQKQLPLATFTPTATTSVPLNCAIPPPPSLLEPVRFGCGCAGVAFVQHNDIACSCSPLCAPVSVCVCAGRKSGPCLTGARTDHQQKQRVCDCGCGCGCGV